MEATHEKDDGRVEKGLSLWWKLVLEDLRMKDHVPVSQSFIQINICFLDDLNCIRNCLLYWKLGVPCLLHFFKTFKRFISFTVVEMGLVRGCCHGEPWGWTLLRFWLNWELEHKTSSSIQVNLSLSPLIGGHWMAWMAGAVYRCAPPARVVGRRLRQEDNTAGREMGCHCTSWPRGTPWISDPELRWSTISSFSDWNNKSQPFDSAPHPPPPPFLRSSSETNSRLERFHSGLQGPGPHSGPVPRHPVWWGLEVQNWFEDRGVVCRCNYQVDLEYLPQPWYQSVSFLPFLQPIEQMLPFYWPCCPSK